MKLATTNLRPSKIHAVTIMIKVYMYTFPLCFGDLLYADEHKVLSIIHSLPYPLILNMNYDINNI